MMRMLRCFLIGCTGMLLLASQAAAHCEIPCGIYDDELRVTALREHITTIEKAMNRIKVLEGEKTHNPNQLVRWIVNKEKHADDLQEIVSQYFMTQRIKPGMKGYQAMLNSLHEMLLAAMKCKQTTDLVHVEELRALVGTFEKLYFRAEE